MTKHPGTADLADQLRLLDQAIRGLSQHIATLESGSLTLETWQNAAAALGTRMAAMDEAANAINSHFGLTSAQSRILRYLKDHVGEVVTNDQLCGVSGVRDTTRRLRELREIHGWMISSNVHRDDLSPGQYVLESLEPRMIRSSSRYA
ncbi:hypothetical protein FHR83_005960 [Actinoplanes campanulatus]|uniref:Uncharacterized protein n=1 Tax=Actinoplanes campanulatus TaxID=113559 RepID=A0A7W5ALC4_9ACTN|nr:hypothetical protein [Actinoplanes campanulatus]MBB3098265.1 hypothetical protein [Actinoplanes campanulatus]